MFADFEVATELEMRRVDGGETLTTSVPCSRRRWHGAKSHADVASPDRYRRDPWHWGGGGLGLDGSLSERCIECRVRGLLGPCFDGLVHGLISIACSCITSLVA
jgi:hypothetical protein